MRKTLSISSIISLWLISSSFLHSDTTNTVASAETSKPLEIKQDTHCTMASPSKKAEMDIRADALFWQATEDGLSFATKSSTVTSSQYTLGKGKIEELDFKWDYGFRTAIGVTFPDRRWDSQIVYTWFHDRAKGRSQTHDGSKILPTFTSSAANAVSTTISNGQVPEPTTTTMKNFAASSAKATWNLYLDVIDWELGKTFIPMKWFSFRPFTGLKASWIHQQYEIGYFGYHALNGSGSTSNVFLHLKNNYWGVGPECGFNTQFWLGRGLSIYGNVCAALVYGEFFIEHKENNVTSSSRTTVTNVHTSYDAGRAITDLQIGLRWDSNVCRSKKAHKCQCPDTQDKMNFSLSAGWEQHMYFSQGEFFRFTDVSNSGNYTKTNADLSLQGATISARFDF